MLDRQDFADFLIKNIFIGHKIAEFTLTQLNRIWILKTFEILGKNYYTVLSTKYLLEYFVIRYSEIFDIKSD